MGQYHLLINLDKKQIVHPNKIGNGLKLKEQIGSPYATATALVMLLAGSSREGGRGSGDFHADHPLVGSWAGDRIAFVGDYAEAGDIPGIDARPLYQQCRAVCLSSKRRNAAEVRPGWTDISASVREMMSAEFGIRYEGQGWLTIVEPDGGEVAPILAPDLVFVRPSEGAAKRRASCN